MAAAAISIIGGADGPTSIFLAGKLGQTDLMGLLPLRHIHICHWFQLFSHLL